MPETTSFYRGGTKVVEGRTLGGILVDLLDVSLYKNIKLKSQKTTKKDLIFASNEDFWKHILKNKAFIGQYITLSNFCLTEWLPMSPGLFYTENAWMFRAEAKKFVVSKSPQTASRIYLDLSIGSRYFTDRKPRSKDGFIELDPRGKVSMVLGGIGSLRLAPKKLFDDERVFLMGASSNGVCHEGVPVILPSVLYNTFISELKENCGLRCKLVGKLCILPTDGLPIKYNRTISKYCLFVEQIKNQTRCSEEDILVSIAITYSTSPKHLKNKQWSFVTFNPHRSDRQLIYSVEWLYDYAKRYSGVKDPFILGDFDEYKQHFEKIDFSLKDIANGKIDFAKLAQYGSFLDFKIINIMGDNFENISGTIINRSIVTNSLNKISHQLDDESADLLKKITQEVEKSGNNDAKDNMEEFHREIQKPEPKKSLLKSFWTGVVTAVPALISNADKVLSIIEKVGTIIPH
jgi:hypothetical protein